MASRNTGSVGGGRIVGMALVGVGALLLTLALALAFYIVPAQKKTPLDTNATTVTETVPGNILIGKALGTNTPTDSNKDRPECRQSEPAPAGGAAPAPAEKKAFPVSCFIDKGVPMYSQRHVSVVDPSDGDQITLQAAQSVIRTDRSGGDGSEGLVSATMDRVTLDRHDAHPSDEATSTLALVDVEGDRNQAPQGFVRGGIQYKFPFDTEQKSYDYFDASTFTVNPIDFVGTTEMNGVEVYQFEQKLGPIDMFQSIRDHFASTGSGYDKTVESILASYQRKGQTAGEWGLPGDPARKVDMRRFYTNTRTLFVNPQTGQIVDGKEDIFQFFAENKGEADAFFADKTKVQAEKQNPTRTAIAFASGWNAETIEKTAAGSQESLDQLNTFGKVLPAVLGLLGLLGILGGLFLGLRRR